MDQVDNIQTPRGTISKRRGNPSGRRAVLAKKNPRQAFATDSSALGLSKNCSSSVDPLSAVVDDWAP